MIKVNGITWRIVYVSPLSDKLMREDGSYTIGMTDNYTKCIYLSNELEGKMLYKVLSHELVHCASFSYDCKIDTDTEEIIADFISLYGKEIVENAQIIFEKLLNLVQMGA